MNLLVIGSGAREHAILAALKRSPQAGCLFAAPGNAGTAAIATNLPVGASDIPALLAAARQHAVELTVVGPETPLAEGAVDCFREAGLAIFGPTRAAARIESSKAFAKELMQRHGIPTAASRSFDSHEKAVAYVKAQETPMVVKADGLAAGKGVVVARTREEALQALEECMVRRAFGDAGERVVVEECLSGREVSVFAFTDGESISPLVAACDYKRAQDGDQGPNTGGMGGYSPPGFWTPALARQIEEGIIRPTVRALAQAGAPYTGVLYAGLMLTSQGPQVLEFNCRLGDPETQVVLPRLETDLVEVVEAVCKGELHRVALRWSQQACVGVVVASGGYPGEYRTGLHISGLEQVPEGALVFHAGTATSDGSVVTSGGRVLTVVGRGRDLADARQRAYAAAKRITFQGAFYRTDIAAVAV
ncbi:MAG: phosphoribosylamine--glycine ligase [Chloroflexi bacterium]|nr:phosphoribosylamine--glycine ligase [Chloroflexota bacterium]